MPSEQPLLDQSRKSDHGVVHMIAGRPVHLPELDELDSVSEPVVRFCAAMTAVNDTHAEIGRIKADQTLSSYGKDQKLDPRRERLINDLAMQIEGLDKFEESIDKREAMLLAVPELHPQNAADAIIDRELRDWWKEQSKGVRMDLLQKMNEAPGHERLEIALLRSPYAQVDIEVKLAREAWNNAKRLQNPAEAQAISMWRKQHEWTGKAFAHLTPIGALLTELPGPKVLEVLVRKGRTNKAMQAFGFDAQSIERAKLLLKR